MAEDQSLTCCTVETPSRLMLFYPDSTPCTLTALLPEQPIIKPVGDRVVLGRSGSADVRLNDERMSRVYASLWHDGKDPFVFRVSNLSERKLLIVDGVMLHYKEEADVKDGTVLTLDFLQFKAKVCGGDFVCFMYQISFIKNVVISPQVPQKSPEGKVLMPTRPSSCNGEKILLSSKFSCQDQSGKVVMDNSTNDVVTRLLTCLRTGSVDSSMDPGVGQYKGGAAAYFARRSHSNPEDDVGVEYELPENICTMSSGYSSITDGFRGLSSSPSMSSPMVVPAGHKLSLNIPPQGLASSPGPAMMVPTASATPSYPPSYCSPDASQNQAQPSASKNTISCWFNMDSTAPSQQNPWTGKKEMGGKDVAESPPQEVQNVLQTSVGKVCPSCKACASEVTRMNSLKLLPDRMEKVALDDMIVQPGNNCQRQPVEHAEWDTDDPNINSYM